MHSSCAAGDAVYVIAGYNKGSDDAISSIEILYMRLNGDLSFAYLRKTWSKTQPDQLTPRIKPFVCAMKDNSLLIYGG